MKYIIYTIEIKRILDLTIYPPEMIDHALMKSGNSIIKQSLRWIPQFIEAGEDMKHIGERDEMTRTEMEKEARD